jgi:glucan phosphoethanolaminetransferase (alkaline phosphatase superfamily)
MLMARAAHAMQQPSGHGTNLVGLPCPLSVTTHFAAELDAASNQHTTISSPLAVQLPALAASNQLAAELVAAASQLTRKLAASIFLLLLETRYIVEHLLCVQISQENWTTLFFSHANESASSMEQLFFIARYIVRYLFFLLAIYEPCRIHGVVVLRGVRWN